MNNATVSKIEVKNVFKIFGNRSKDALAMVGQGKTKDQVLAETGCVVGVNDLSLSIGSGEIFVIMGCLLYTSPSPRDGLLSRMPSSA